MPLQENARLIDTKSYSGSYNDVYTAALGAVAADGRVRSSSKDTGEIVGGDGAGYWSKTLVVRSGNSRIKVSHYMDSAYVCCNKKTQQERTAQLFNFIQDSLPEV